MKEGLDQFWVCFSKNFPHFVDRICLALKLEPYFQQRAMENLRVGGKYKSLATVPEARHIDIEGRNPRRLTQAGNGGTASISPDGKWIVYSGSPPSPVGVQTSKLFPSISITVEYVGQSGTIGSLVNAAARFYSVGPTIQWGLLNYPALRSNIRVYKAKRDEQVLTYQKTVVTAFQDVDDALVGYEKEQARQKILETEVTQYQRAASLALAKYTRGLSNFLNVLEAQRSLYSAQDSLVQSKATVQTDLIALYKASGGGWEKNDPVATPETSVTLGNK